MTPTEATAHKFWHAATFIRRAPERNPDTAIAILIGVTKSTSETLRQRALEILKEIQSEPGRND